MNLPKPIKASTSIELRDAINTFLKAFKSEGMYIVDRSMYAAFGDIFKDGMTSYSVLDLFVERVYKPNYIKMLDKKVPHFEQLDLDIMEVYNENMGFIENVANLTVEATEDEVKRATMIAADLEKLMKSIKSEEKEVKLPYFVNSVTEEEIPLLSLGNVSDEAITEWGEKLAVFSENFKSVVTPMEMSAAYNPNGLTVAAINNIYWYDIVVR